MTEPLLRAEGLDVSYGPSQALFGVSIDVAPGSVLAVLGVNGAGKSTFARAVSGLVPPTAGRVTFAGQDITGLPAHRIRRLGLTYIPEGRGIFPGLSVTDNLRMAVAHEPRGERSAAIQRAIERFPVLGTRPSQRAGNLSGGEQQMLALARALSRNPSILLADELSLGLAPKIVDRLLGAVRTAADERGTGALIVEQHAHKALKYADRMYLMARGQILLELPAAEAIKRLDEIEEAYMRGTSETEEDHLERLRRKNKKKQWRRQRVREHELQRLTGKTVSTRREEDDEYYFDAERQRRDWSQRARR